MDSDIYTVISGTNRPGSNTKQVAGQYYHLLQQKGLPVHLVTLEGLDIHNRNEQIKQLEKDVLIPTRKFIFIVPEYNGSFPGVLKALIDHSDIENVWWGKKALLTGVSTGRAGNLRGLEHLTGVLHYLKMNVHHNKLPISVVNKLMNGEKDIGDETTLRVIADQLDQFISF